MFRPGLAFLLAMAVSASLGCAAGGASTDGNDPGGGGAASGDDGGTDARVEESAGAPRVGLATKQRVDEVLRTRHGATCVKHAR